MTRLRRIKLHRFVIILFFNISVTLLFFNGICCAEVVTDGSLGSEAALAGPDFNVASDLGQLRGSNLFHSFRDFSIQFGESATFSGPAGIDNIISRVTGGNSSYINGLLRSTIDGADFFLLNPSGVIFGPWATLDIKGSFHASTADYLRFDDGSTFFSDLSRQSVLSVARPEAFGFLTDNPADIVVDDSQLAVPSAETLSLIGGDLSIQGGMQPAEILAPQGTVQLVGVGKSGEINLNCPELSIPSDGAGGSIQVSNATISDAYDASRTVIIKGGRILFDNTAIAAEGTRGTDDTADPAVDIASESQLELSNSSILCFSGGSEKGGDLRIHADEFTMSGASWIDVIAAGEGGGGDTDIDTQTLVLDGESCIQTSSYSTGTAGSLKVDVSENLSLKDASSIRSWVYDLGHGGDIDINANVMSLEGGAYVETWSETDGDCGSIGINTTDLKIQNGSGVWEISESAGDLGIIQVNVNDQLVLNNNASIETIADGQGLGGDISIHCRSLILEDESKIRSILNGSRINGSIQINTLEEISLKNESIIGAYGYDWSDSADISINSNSLTLESESAIWNISSGAGACGSINIEASDSVLIHGGGPLEQTTGIRSGETDTENAGSAGEISIFTPYLELSNEGAIVSTAGGEAMSGDITIDAEVVHMDSGHIESFGDIGDSGDIIIQTNTLEAFNNSMLSAITGNIGNAGTIEILAENILFNGSFIDNFTSNIGQGGDIKIEADQLVIQNGSMIEAYTTGEEEGLGGNISIKVDDLIVNGNGTNAFNIISAQSRGPGHAGNVSIDANTVNLVDGGRISVETSGGGDAGELHIIGDSLLMDGVAGSQNVKTGLFADSTGDGQAGAIILNIDDIRIQSGAQISTETAGAQGGNIDIVATNINLQNGAQITAKSTGTGNAGNIDLQVSDTFFGDHSNITTEAAMSDGGNIQINAGEMIRLTESGVMASVGGGPATTGGNLNLQSRYVVLKNSQLTANAFEGHGGNINITADSYLADPSSIVDASSALGIDGMVDIRAPFSNLSGSLKPLPKDFMSAANLLKEPCEARVRGGDYGSFTVKGRDALPTQPGSLQMSPPLEF